MRGGQLFRSCRVFGSRRVAWGGLLIGLSVGLMIAGLPFQASAQPTGMVMVLDARGTGLKVGQRLERHHRLILREGERVTLIEADGRTQSRRGPYDGPAVGASEETAGSQDALKVLLNMRTARTNSIGVVRGEPGDVAPLPAPWLIDISRPGVRCLREGELPRLWRPEVTREETVVLFPPDRSWRADFRWAAGRDTVDMPRLARFEGPQVFLVNRQQREYALTLVVIPKAVDSPWMLAGWMLERDCTQQADAVLMGLGAAPAGAPTGAR